MVCTHGHNDHITVAPELGKALDAPVLLHPADDMLWRMTHPDKEFRSFEDGATLTVGGVELRALHTPGHSPGSVCWYAPDLGAVFSGDTLFQGGPGATGRSYSDFPTILDSISKRLGMLPGETVVYTGHGDTTKIGDEIVHYDEWVARGASSVLRMPALLGLELVLGQCARITQPGKGLQLLDPDAVFVGSERLGRLDRHAERRWRGVVADGRYGSCASPATPTPGQ